MIEPLIRIRLSPTLKNLSHEKLLNILYGSEEFSFNPNKKIISVQLSFWKYLNVSLALSFDILYTKE